MWTAPAGRLRFNTLPFLIICLLLVTDAKAPWKQTTMTPSSSSSGTSGLNVVPGIPVLIVLSVFVVLLLCAIFLYFFLKWKQNKHARRSSSNMDHLNNRQLGHTAEDYEEIKDYKVCANLHLIYNNADMATEASGSPAELQPTAEDFDAIKDTEYHPELCSVNTMTETPAGPLDPATDLTQSHENTTANFLSNVHSSELGTAPDSAEQE